MSAPLVDVQIGGLNLRVESYCGTDETKALVERVNDRLKEIESRSSKVNTHAFALQAAYEFAMEAAQAQATAAREEARLTKSIQEFQRRVDVFRRQIEDTAQTAI